MKELDVIALFKVFNKYSVDYIIIGGVAVGVHGYVRATKDLDIVPSPTEDNYAQLAAALNEINAEIDVGDLEPVVELNLDGFKLGGNFVTETDLGRVDIMQFQGDREDLYQFLVDSAIELEVEDFQVKFCGLEDLIKLKTEAGRPADIIDIDNIREINS